MSPAEHYFAYGSNLHAEDLARWCREKQRAYPLGRAIGRAYLPDRELAFHYRSVSRRGGALDVRERLGQLVEGVIFEVNEGGWETLDQKEGGRTKYVRQEVHVLDEDGGVRSVTTYVVREQYREPHHVPPREDYVAIVRAGMQQHGVEGEPQLAAAAEAREAPWRVDALFAYGTLMRGERFFAELASLARLECALLATTRGRLLDLGSYPGMELAPEGPPLRGELFRVGNVDTVLRRVDAIEGFARYEAGSLYDRVLMQIDAGDGRMRLAWTYVLGATTPRGPEIDSGCWRTHTGRHERFVRRLAREHCGDRDAEIAAALADRIPLSLDGRRRDARDVLLPLADAILRGDVSERRLAQLSGRWACLTGPDTGH